MRMLNRQEREKLLEEAITKIGAEKIAPNSYIISDEKIYESAKIDKDKGSFMLSSKILSELETVISHYINTLDEDVDPYIVFTLEMQLLEEPRISFKVLY